MEEIIRTPIEQWDENRLKIGKYTEGGKEYHILFNTRKGKVYAVNEKGRFYKKFIGKDLEKILGDIEFLS